jgi:hypothetical protein
MSNNKTWKDFVVMLHDLGVQNTSSEIARVINRSSDEQVSWCQVAGVKSAITRKNK